MEGSAVTTDVDGARVVVVEATFDVVAGVVVTTLLVVEMNEEAVVVEVNSSAVVVVTVQLLDTRIRRRATGKLPDDMVTRHRARCISQTTIRSPQRDPGSVG